MTMRETRNAEGATGELAEPTILQDALGQIKYGKSTHSSALLGFCTWTSRSL